MKTWLRVTAVTIIVLLSGSGVAVAKDKKDAKKAGCEQVQPSAAPGSRAPQMIDGQVVGIDQASGMVTVKAADGQTHQFRGNAETLKDLKVGDQLEAKLRTVPNC